MDAAQRRVSVERTARWHDGRDNRDAVLSHADLPYPVQAPCCATACTWPRRRACRLAPEPASARIPPAVFPCLGRNCRLHPTCSVYAIAALERHEPLRGTWLMLWRLARCNSWGGTGYDPVLPLSERKTLK
ncbi:MAG: membrane protein insertion efficiency factor YidD [Sedimentitalea sp.]|uniref:membrane protein insertion efficiency factor YidD n=1 Tax=Sedimentitalea sp. TaxID=2048915 RepID=UPI003266CB73